MIGNKIENVNPCLQGENRNLNRVFRGVHRDVGAFASKHGDNSGDGILKIGQRFDNCKNVVLHSFIHNKTN